MRKQLRKWAIPLVFRHVHRVRVGRDAGAAAGAPRRTAFWRRRTRPSRALRGSGAPARSAAAALPQRYHNATKFTRLTAYVRHELVYALSTLIPFCT